MFIVPVIPVKTGIQNCFVKYFCFFWLIVVPGSSFQKDAASHTSAAPHGRLCMPNRSREAFLKTASGHLICSVEGVEVDTARLVVTR